MKKFLPFLTAAASCSLCLIACGDSSSVEDEPENYGHFREVLSEDDLYACTSRFEGTSVFIIDEKRSFKCEDGTWYEIDVEQMDELEDIIKSTLKYAADDTVTSLSMRPACTISRDSMTVYVASIGGYQMCLDYEWIEVDGRNIKLRPRSSSSMDDDIESSSSEEKGFKGYSSGSKIIPIAPSNGDSSCNALTEGTIKSTSSFYDYVYLCKSGAWFTIDAESIDMMDLKDTTDGVFKAGKVPNKLSVFSSFCPNPDTSFEYNMYVFEGEWRTASKFELCLNKACMASNIGDTASMNVFQYVCDTSGWRGVDVIKDSIGKEKYINNTLVYMDLKDSRDDQIYKAIKIGDYTWMAENLNFADSLVPEFDNLQGGQSSTLTNDPSGKLAGRLYSYTGAMNILYKYSSTRIDSLIVKKHHRGVCPSGWHVPDTSEWRNLINATDNESSALKSTVGWPYYRDTEQFVPTNASGFSAVPFGSSSVRYCTASQGYYSDEYVAAIIDYNYYSVNFDDNMDKDYKCYLRCVMDYEPAEPEVDESSSSAENTSSSGLSGKSSSSSKMESESSPSEPDVSEEPKSSMNRPMSSDEGEHKGPSSASSASESSDEDDEFEGPSSASSASESSDEDDEFEGPSSASSASESSDEESDTEGAPTSSMQSQSSTSSSEEEPYIIED